MTEQNETKSRSSIREKYAPSNAASRREKIIDDIKNEYKEHGQYQVTKTIQKNIMLIGRTRTGKSTIKALLVDPTTVPDELTLKSGTREPLFESFHVRDNRIVLNIIDTPGLFEHGNVEMDIRDNDAIMKTIEICVNREITKFHAICFCVSIITGINKEDVDSLKILANFLGEEISNHACLIITRCESKDEEQREKMCQELLEDIHFREIASFFKMGIFFSGSLNRDDYNQGNESLYRQFFTISDYRTKLIELFTNNNDPFPINDMLISQVRRARYQSLEKDEQIKQLQSELQEHERARLLGSNKYSGFCKPS